MQVSCEGLEQEPMERGEEAVAMQAAELASQVAEADAAQVSVPHAEAAIHNAFFPTFTDRCCTLLMMLAPVCFASVHVRIWVFMHMFVCMSTYLHLVSVGATSALARVAVCSIKQRVSGCLRPALAFLSPVVNQLL